MWKHSIIALATLGSVLAFSVPASAFPTAPPPAMEADNSGFFTVVRSRGGGHYNGMGYNHYRGNYRHYGYRNYCNSWNNNCGYRNRYYYGNPWWVLGGIGFGYGLGYGSGYYGGGYYNNGYYNGGYNRGYGSRHVAWCLNHYRSYNPRTNTWVSYSGRIHRCHSPYRY
jgi:hypothetical protein